MRPSTSIGARPHTVVARRQQNDDVSVITNRTGWTRRTTVSRGMARPLTASASGSVARHRPSGSNDFASLLLRKEKELVDELERLRIECQTMTEEKSALPSLRDKRERLEQDVNELEASLMDHNITMNHLRSGADMSTMEEANAKLADENERLADEVDRIFLLTQERENDVTLLEKQMASIMVSRLISYCM